MPISWPAGILPRRGRPRPCSWHCTGSDIIVPVSSREMLWYLGKKLVLPESFCPVTSGTWKLLVWWHSFLSDGGSVAWGSLFLLVNSPIPCWLLGETWQPLLGCLLPPLLLMPGTKVSPCGAPAPSYCAATKKHLCGNCCPAPTIYWLDCLQKRESEHRKFSVNPENICPTWTYKVQYGISHYLLWVTAVDYVTGEAHVSHYNTIMWHP